MPEFWIYFSWIITLLYVGMILWLYVGLKRISQFEYKNTTQEISFSILIAFRNEVENLPVLLSSLIALNYPRNLFEILLINDGSSDDSVAVVKSYIAKYPEINMRVVNNRRKSISPKKDAINTAIRQSNFEWIVTTDADCQVPENWLRDYNAFIIENQPVLVAGLVTYDLKKRFLHQFQRIDWLSLTSVTIGSFGQNKPLICSGANLAYSKKRFYEVNAFQGNEHIASGDDVFLLHKMKDTYPDRVFFMNIDRASVRTKSLPTWRDLYRQRIRWAKKTSSLSKNLIKYIGLIVFIMNTLLLLLFLKAFSNMTLLILFFFLFLTKFLVDSILIKKISKTVHQKIALKAWLLSSILYPIFSTSVLIVGTFTNYTWKGRKYKK